MREDTPPSSHNSPRKPRARLRRLAACKVLLKIAGSRVPRRLSSGSGRGGCPTLVASVAEETGARLRRLDLVGKKKSQKASKIPPPTIHREWGVREGKGHCPVAQLNAVVRTRLRQRHLGEYCDPRSQATPLTREKRGWEGPTPSRKPHPRERARASSGSPLQRWREVSTL